jgi:cyanophycinase
MSRGRLLLMGGGEDPDEDDMRLLPRLVEMAGGDSARILICGAPTREPEEKFGAYRPLFERLGVRAVHEIPVAERSEAAASEALDALHDATAVFLPGGDQLRITTHLAATDMGRRMRTRFDAGELVVAGTSAGAAAVTGTMIIGGEDGSPPSRKAAEMAPGLAYWPEAIVEPHFSERGRIGRLVAALAQNPRLLAVGIDSDTAVEVDPRRSLRVLGSGSVTLLDGRTITRSTAAEANASEVIVATGLTMHCLAEGWGFDLEERVPLPPPEADA